jgi:Tfp pilus assembly protein PilF
MKDLVMRRFVMLILTAVTLVGCSSATPEEPEKEASSNRMYVAPGTAGAEDRRKRDQIRAECALGLQSGRQCAEADSSLDTELKQATGN